MDWLRRSFGRIKRTSVISSAKPTVSNQSQPFSSQDLRRRGKLVNSHGCDRNTSWSYSSDNVFRGEEVFSPQNIFQRLGMRLKKDYKIRTREGSRGTVKPEILKIRKTHNKSFKSPIVRPKRVKSKSSWVQRLLSKSSINNNDQDVGEYYRAAEEEVEEAVHEVYTNQFMDSEHFNLVGEDKNLGPLVLSIKYPIKIVEKGRQRDTLGPVSDKTILLLRLPTGLVKQSWNQFQLSNPSLKSPLDLAKLSVPHLSLSRLLPVLSPEVSQLIAEHDEGSGEETKYGRVDLKKSGESKTLQLISLQEKLITSTCKYIELSNWDLEEYENFFTKKKMNLPKYLSFTMPAVAMKTPKSCSRNVNRMKSPKFMSLPKKILQFEDDNSTSSPSLNLKPLVERNDLSPVENEDFPLFVETVPVLDLTGQMVKLSTDDPEDEAGLTDIEGIAEDKMVSKLTLILVKLRLEKEELLEINGELEKQKEELTKNGKRLVRELSTAHTIMDCLERKLQLQN